MEGHCKYDGRLGEMEAVMKRLIQEIYGNGQEGLARTMPRQAQKMDILIMEVAELKTAVSGILRYVQETQGFQQGKRDQKQKTFSVIQRISLLIGICIAVLTAFKILNII